MKTLSDYQITFRRDAMFGCWYWTAVAPNGETLKGAVFWSSHREGERRTGRGPPDQSSR